MSLISALSRRRRPLTGALASLLAIWQIGQPLQGAQFTWDANTGTSGVQDGLGTWNTGAIWWNPLTSTNVTAAAADTLLFGGASTGGVGGAITLDGNRSIAGLLFGNTTTTGYSFIADASPRTLTIGTSGITLFNGAQQVSVGTTNLSLILSGNQTWSNLSANALLVGGSVDMNTRALALRGTGGFTFNGALTGTTATLNQATSGVTTINAAAGYAGATTVSNGTLVLGGAAGALTASATINLNRGALTLDNTVSSVADRIHNAAAIAVNGTSTLNFNVNTASGSFSESLGTVTMNNGAFNVATTQAVSGQTSVLTLAAISRTGTNYSTANFRGTGLGAAGNAQNRLLITGQAGGDIGPWATYGNGDFAAYNTTVDTGFARGVIASTPTTLAAGSNDATQNMKTAAAITVTAGLNPEYKTLAISSTTARTLTVNANDIYLVSGGLLSNGQSHIIGSADANRGTLTTGAKTAGTSVPLYVTTNDVGGTARILTINSIIRNNPGGGALDLVKSGTSTLTVAGANTYSGATIINEGILRSSATEPANFNGGLASSWLGTSSNAAANLVLNGGTLFWAGPTAGTTDRLFTLGAGGGGITNNAASNGTLTFSNTGAIAFSGSGDRSLTLTANGSGTFTFSPIIGNPTGGVTSVNLAGAAPIVINSNNTFTGGGSITGAGRRILTHSDPLQTSITPLGTASSWLIGAGALLDFRSPTNASTNFGGTVNYIIGDNSVTLATSSAVNSNATTATIGTLTLGNATVTIARGSNMNANQTSSITTGAVSLLGNPVINLNSANGSSTSLLSLGALNDNGFARTITLGGGAGTGAHRLRLTAATTGFTAGTNLIVNATNNVGVRLDNATAFGTATAPGLITFNSASTVGGLELRNNSASNFRTNLVFGDNSVNINIGGGSGSQTSKTHTIGALSIGGATMTVAGSLNTAADNVHSITFGATTLTGNPTFTSNLVNGTALGALTLGALNDGGVARAITKNGPGTLALNSAATSFLGTSSVLVTKGRLSIGINSALGSGPSFAPITLGDGATDSGTLVVGSGVSLDHDITFAGGAFGVTTSGVLADVVAISGPASGTATLTGTININAAPTEADVRVGHLKGGGGTLVIDGPIVTGGSSGGAVSIHSGLITLQENTGNTYTSLTIQEGTTSLGVSNAVPSAASVNLGTNGTGELALSAFNQTVGASSTWTLGGTGTSAAAVATISGTSGVLTLAGTIANNIGSTATQLITADIDLNATTATFNIDSGAVGSDMTVSGDISNGSLLKNGNGILTLNGTNNLGAGSTLNVSNGTVIGNFGTSGVENISVGGTGSLQFVGGGSQVLNLGSGNLTLTNGFRLGFQLDTTGVNDQLITAAIVSAGAAGFLDFYNLGGLADGNSYTLIQGGAGSNLSGTTWNVGNAPDGFDYLVSSTDTTVSLNVQALVARYWRGGTDNSWVNGGLGNWTSDLAGTLNVADPDSTGTVIFSSTAAPMSGTTITTTLDTDFVIRAMQFKSNPATISAVNINEGIAGSDLTISPISSSSGIRVEANAGNVTFNSDANDFTLVAAAPQTWDVSNTGASLTVNANVNFSNSVTKAGPGVLTLGGANTGAAGLILSSGTLNLDNNAALGTGALTILAGSSIDSTTGVTLANAGGQNWNGNFTFVGTNILNTGTAGINLNSNVSVTTTAGNLTVGGVIDDGAGTFTLSKLGSGTLTLAAANTHGGGVTVSAGTLNLNHDGALGSGTLTLGAGSTLDNTSGADRAVSTNNAQTWLGNFAYAGSLGDDLNLGTGAVDLAANTTVTVSNGELKVDGIIDDGLSNFALNKAGTGTLYLTGANTFGSNTTLNISGGVLKVDSDANLGNSLNDITFTGNGEFHATTGFSTTGRVFAIGATTSTMRVDTGSLVLNSAATISLGGTLIKAGSGTLELAIAATGLDGTLRVDDGILLGRASANVFGDGTNRLNIVLNGGDVSVFDSTARALNNNTTLEESAIIYTDRASLGNGVTHTMSSGTLTVNGVNKTLEVVGGAFTNAGFAGLSFGAVTLNSGVTFKITDNTIGTGDTRLTLGAVTNNGNSITVDGDGLLAQSGVWGGGSGGLTLAGTYAGTVTLNQVNTFTGDIAINGGTLNVGLAETVSATDGPLGADTSVISFGGGTLQYSAVNNADYSGRFSTAINQAYRIDTNSATVAYASALTSSGGSLTKLGLGSLTLNNVGNTYTGSTTVNGGTLVQGVAGSIPTGTNVTVNAIGTGMTASLSLNNINLTVGTLSFGGSTTTSSSSVSNGTGTLTLGGNVTYDATNNPATAQILGGGLDLGGVDRTFTVGNSTTQVVDLRITSAITNGAVTKEGLGTLEFTGTNTYGGTTTINAGTLLINGDNSGANGNIIIGANGTLGGNGLIGGATTITGIHSPGNSAAIQTFNNGLSYSAGSSFVWELFSNSTDAIAEFPTGIRGGTLGWDGADVTGNLSFNGSNSDPFSLSLVFNGATSTVDWSDLLWGANTYHQWKIWSFSGTLNSGWNDYFNITSNWLDKDGDDFSAYASNWWLTSDANNIYLNFSAIPEPSRALLILIGALGMTLRRRRKTI